MFRILTACFLASDGLGARGKRFLGPVSPPVLLHTFHIPSFHGPGVKVLLVEQGISVSLLRGAFSIKQDLSYDDVNFIARHLGFHGRNSKDSMGGPIFQKFK